MSLSTPWRQMTEREQAFWNDICECGHTRLDHGSRCTHWEEKKLKRRQRCRSFRYSMSFEQYVQAQPDDGPFMTLARAQREYNDRLQQ